MNISITTTAKYNYIKVHYLPTFYEYIPTIIKTFNGFHNYI